MIKNIKYVFVFIYIGFFTLAGFASEEKERAHPVVIRIIPQSREYIQACKTSESVPLKNAGFEDDLRYLDEYGYKDFFVYDVAAINGFRPAVPQQGAPRVENPDYATLKGLSDYRKANLNNSNPMIVRLRVYDEKGEWFPVTLGLFISGENNFQITKKVAPEPLDVEDFLCSGSFKLDYKLVGYLKNDIIETKNVSKGFKPILTVREKLTTEAEKVIEEHRKTREFQDLEANIRKAIRDRVESQIIEKLQEYTSPSGVVYGVPPFQNNFPNSLPSLNILNPWITEHYVTVVERIYDVNLRRGNRTALPFTAVPPLSSEFNTFLLHVVKNLHIEKFCFNLFGKNPFDGHGQDGCFQSAFSYYFTDSEQAFLRWLDKYQIMNVESSSPLGKESTKILTQIDVEFVSYLDMCPPCRGTMSYLATKMENDQTLPWLQRRILNYLQGEMVKGNIGQMKVAQNVPFNMFC
jgi:hypothetical protein